MRASLISVILPALAAAGPIIEARGPNEGVYLTNCLRFEPGINYSEMDYYTDAKHKSQNGERPNDLTYLGGYKGEYTPGKDFRVKWEGQQVCGTFSSTGEVFCSNIFANGATLADGASAGTGHNKETNFNCYKDTGRTLYSSTGILCHAMYYCFDA